MTRRKWSDNSPEAIGCAGMIVGAIVAVLLIAALVLADWLVGRLAQLLGGA